ncbi:MAG TPA: hypothetical protein VF516_14375, partial [Kofleriaceae bacterium]
PARARDRERRKQSPDSPHWVTSCPAGDANDPPAARSDALRSDGNRLAGNPILQIRRRAIAGADHEIHASTLDLNDCRSRCIPLHCMRARVHIGSG